MQTQKPVPEMFAEGSLNNSEGSSSSWDGLEWKEFDNTSVEDWLEEFTYNCLSEGDRPIGSANDEDPPEHSRRAGESAIPAILIGEGFAEVGGAVGSDVDSDIDPQLCPSLLVGVRSKMNPLQSEETWLECFGGGWHKWVETAKFALWVVIEQDKNGETTNNNVDRQETPNGSLLGLVAINRAQERLRPNAPQSTFIPTTPPPPKATSDPYLNAPSPCAIVLNAAPHPQTHHRDISAVQHHHELPLSPMTSGLDRGKSRNHQDGRLLCNRCTKTFKREGDVRRHYKKHFPSERKFHCFVGNCSRNGDRGFYRRDKLADHQRKRHRIVASALPLLLPQGTRSSAGQDAKAVGEEE